MSSATQTHPSTIVRLRAAFVALRSLLGRLPLSLILLAMRVAVGSVFFKSGMLKINSFEFAVKLFEDEYKLPLLDPAIAARLAAFTEVTFPVFLFLGLATRLATLPLLGMTMVIQVFVYPDAWVENLLWASILALLLTRGAGVLSVDFLVDQWFASKTKASK